MLSDGPSTTHALEVWLSRDRGDPQDVAANTSEDFSVWYRKSVEWITAAVCFVLLSILLRR